MMASGWQVVRSMNEKGAKYVEYVGYVDRPWVGPMSRVQLRHVLPSITHQASIAKALGRMAHGR